MDALFRQSDESLVKESLLAQLSVGVKEVQADVASVEKNSDSSASSLSTVLEAIFIHGLKETLMNRMSQAIITDFGPRPDPNFWAPLLIFSHRDVIHQISCLSQVTTDVGRGRAWLRLALNEGLLSSYLCSMLSDNNSLKPYYNLNSFLRDSEKLDVARQLIEGVESCSFNYVCNSSLLNIWTNMPLLMAGISVAPLRSCPISSGTDVAQMLDPDESKKYENTIPSLTDPIRNSRFSVNEEEALKIILGTPINESPLQVKLNSELFEEENQFKSGDGENSSNINPKNYVLSTSNTTAELSTNDTVITEDTESKIKPNTNEKSQKNKTKGTLSSVPIRTSSQQSYDSLLASYNNLENNLKSPNLEEVIKRYNNCNAIEENDNGGINAEADNSLMVSSINSWCDFEIVPTSSSAISNVVPEYSCLIHNLTNIAIEQGLDRQNYCCAYCKNPVGVNLDNVRICGFTGDYYCKDCYGRPKESWIIPARVLHNWDFEKYSISERAEKFLLEIQDHPLLDMKAINPKLYIVTDEMSILQNLRMKLNLLRAYLFTCRESAGEDLKKQIWPKEYLYDHLHLYSVSDLIKIENGSLIQLLENAVNFSKSHVHSCNLCKVKGFICEICSADTVIYPFDIEKTFKCRLCNGVYHSHCMDQKKACPKCYRQKQRREQTEDHL